eukprot:TRINITY_DN33200_c0_g1_i1.p1 TRINITY_DN33200_c0_g1~~TRINITY_DN33200_c0_g1_i1.p1  ORF type:complete len:343 (-),score=81.75 TRINITY_DN33200_c0_g1_i1:99-1127(-)
MPPPPRRRGWPLAVVLLLTLLGTSLAQQCNVSTAALSVPLPCTRPRCRFRNRGGRNKTERGLAYARQLIDKFFDEWGDYQGFLGLESAFFIHLLSTIQSDLGVFGTIGEIGVAAGKSFVTLALAKRGGERLFVNDLFAGIGHPEAEKTDVEVESDNAAMSNLPMFLDTLSFAGIPHRHVTIHEGPSFELSDTMLQRLGVAPFRIFHVDGGHFLEAALHDLRVAACTLAPGGVIMLDDLNTGIFPGVQEAFHRFMILDRPRLRPDLVPFLHIGRLYLADRPYADLYRERIRDNLPGKAFWKNKKYMYGEEVLLPGGLMNLDTSIRNIVDLEEEFFPWSEGRRR